MSASIKKDRATQKFWLLLEVGTAPADLTGKTVVATMAMPDESTPQTLTVTVPTQSGGDLGRFNFDVTTANLAALGTPAQVLVVWNIWNADDSLFRWGSALFDVKL